MSRHFIFVGAGADHSGVNPGGQTTASIGIHAYAERHGLSLHLVDTRQNSFPVPPLTARLYKGFSRVKQVVSILWKKKILMVQLFLQGQVLFL